MTDRRLAIGPSVQGWVLPYLIAAVETSGTDASPIRRLFGSTPLADPDIRVAEATAEMAWRLAVHLTRDRALGIHVAESIPRGTLDLVEYALRSSESLQAGLGRLARYGRVVSDRAAIRTHGSEGSLLMVVRDAASMPLHPARAEFALAVALKLSRDSTGTDITPLQVCFVHPAPDDTSEHRRFFHRRVLFAAGTTSMRLSASDAARPMREADAALAAVIRRHLDKALVDRDRSGTGSISLKVRQTLVANLGRVPMRPDAVAAMLAVSRRTLTRRLAEEHTTFREILDEVRRGFALALLRDPCGSVADIGFFLQYPDPAAFHRAFRRWTGKTPREFRQAGNAEAVGPHH